MTRLALLLTLTIAACTGGPLDTYGNHTGTDTGTDTGGDTGSDTGSDTSVQNTTADIGLFQDCAEAQASAVDLAPGTYSGTTDDWTRSLDGTCVAGSGLSVDKLFRIEVPDSKLLSIDFGVTGNDARVYIVENCNTSSTCLASVNATGLDGTEHLEWGNDSGSTATVYGVLDTRDDPEPGDAWTLTVALQDYSPPNFLDLADTCAQLGNVDAITASGTWPIAMDGFADDIDPYYSATCDLAGYGADGIVPVVVPAFGTMSATFDSPDCDSALYVQQTCGTDVCADAADDGGTGDPETVSVTNTSDTDETLALVLDHYSSSCVPTAAAPGSLDVTLSGKVFRDTCTDAAAADPAPNGTFYLGFSGAADDLDLADATASCTGHASPGTDVFVPVHVPDGDVLHARFQPTSGNAALYVVTACDDPDTCVAGSDSGDPESVRWTNDTGGDADVYLVVDSQYASSDPSAPPDGELWLAVADSSFVSLADTCTDLPSNPLVGQGTYSIGMDGYAADFDPYGSCGYVYAEGADGFFQVRVPARGTLDLTYDASCDTVLYLTTACGDADTCLDGEDSYYSDSLSWTNDLGVPTDVVVGLDTDYTSCLPTFADPGTLDVTVEPPPSAGADTCVAAEALQPVGSGIYPLDLSAATATLDPADAGGCGTVSSAYGAEQFVPIAVGAGQQLDLTLDVDRGLPDLYLVTDCADAGTCLGGTSSGAPEELSWFNVGADAVVYAVVDTDAADGSQDEPQSAYLEADVYTPVVSTTAGNDCADAVALGPLPSGTYSVDLSGFTNTLDLADGSGTPCTDGLRTPGNDGFFQVLVPDGDTLSATWDPSISTSGIHNGSLYLLSTCGDPDACLVGSDSGDPESVTWTNTSGSQAVVWLVVDSWSNTGGPNAGILTLLVAP